MLLHSTKKARSSLSSPGRCCSIDAPSDTASSCRKQSTASEANLPVATPLCTRPSSPLEHGVRYRPLLAANLTLHRDRELDAIVSRLGSARRGSHLPRSGPGRCPLLAPRSIKVLDTIPGAVQDNQNASSEARVFADAQHPAAVTSCYCCRNKISLTATGARRTVAQTAAAV